MIRLIICEIESQCCIEIMCPCYFVVLCSEPAWLDQSKYQESAAWEKIKKDLNITRKRAIQNRQKEERQTGNINLLSAMKKYSTASEFSAFSLGSRSHFVWEKDNQAYLFSLQEKVLLCQTSAAPKSHSTTQWSQRMYRSLY